MITVKVSPTPDEDKKLLSFSVEGKNNEERDAIDELYAVLMTHRFLGLRYKDSNTVEALLTQWKNQEPQS
jgi:hypothetical protein